MGYGTIFGDYALVDTVTPGSEGRRALRGCNVHRTLEKEHHVDQTFLLDVPGRKLGSKWWSDQWFISPTYVHG